MKIQCTHQQFISFIRVINGISGLINLIAFGLWVNFLVRIIKYFKQGVINDKLINWLSSSFIDGFISVLVILVIWCLISFFFTLYINQAKTRWWLLYCLLFFFPTGIILISFVLQKRYWVSKSPNELINWAWTEPNVVNQAAAAQVHFHVSPNSKTRFEQKLFKNQQKQRWALKKIVEKSLQNQDVGFINLVQQITNTDNLAKINWNKLAMVDLLKIKAIFELTPQKRFHLIELKPNINTDLSVAFAIKQKESTKLPAKLLKLKNHYLQLVFIHDVYAYGYEQLFAIQKFLKENKHQFPSFLVTIYTTKVFKTFLNYKNKSHL